MQGPPFLQPCRGGRGAPTSTPTCRDQCQGEQCPGSTGEHRAAQSPEEWGAVPAAPLFQAVRVEVSKGLGRFQSRPARSRGGYDDLVI